MAMTKMKLVRAENYLCFFALLEMIMSDIGVSDMNQFSIADFFEVVYPPGHSRTTKNYRFSDDSRQLGAHIDAIVLNDFFKANEIHCSCTHIPANHICEFTFDDMLSGIVKAGNYAIVAFSYGALNNDSETYEIGHVGLVQRILSPDAVEVYDPGPKGDGHKIVSILSLFDAMRCRNGGIYLITTHQQNSVT